MIKNLHLSNCTEIREFLETNKNFQFEVQNKDEKYKLIKETWFNVKYWKLSKKDKRIVIDYLNLLTGYKRSQLLALLKKAREGRLVLRGYKRNSFTKKYTNHDIALLAETDGLHLCLNSKATQYILKREFEIFGNTEYERLSKISSSYIYVLRKKLFTGLNMMA